ncbi:hypothetical protein O181_032103 [Austropuccinia psidii MF-1]|uniref:Uncharacterized protein n=1 Tax=Austropuccinia psidii MF-1 TaxID=1389203 RepID=A0A9Q3D0Z9_9BASI|nr:hypothetical protein [Austropuccinia psidii MF-1]
MEAAIQSNQMDMDKEEARPNPDLESLPQERHVWRMPELPPIPQGMNHFQVEELEIYQSQYKNLFRAAKEEEWKICPSLWQGAMNSYLHIKSFLGQEKTIELLGGWSPLSCKDKFKKIKNWLRNQGLLSIDQKKELEMTPDLEKEGPVLSTSSKQAPEMSKDKPKGPQKKQKGPKNYQGKGKGKANWHRPYPQGYRTPKLEPSAVDSVSNMARSLMELTAKEQEKKDKPLTWFLKQKDKFSALHTDMSYSMIVMNILRKCRGELEHAIKCICVEPCSSEHYINAMEDIITRTRIGKTWTRNTMESKMIPKISKEDKRPEKPVLKIHKCGS